MPEWMIKGKAREKYLQECKNVELDDIQSSPVLMNMFNKPEQYKVVYERLVELFGSLNGKHIIEIGGGYGGQAKVICDNCTPSRYTIIDLPEVTDLQRRFLKDYPVECRTTPLGNDWFCLSVDLVISNYALSEIPDNRVYMKAIVHNAIHGYITCNTDFVNIPYAKRIADIPGERETNYVLWW